jgi:hypothetical protein
MDHPLVGRAPARNYHGVVDPSFTFAAETLLSRIAGLQTRLAG